MFEIYKALAPGPAAAVMWKTSDCPLFNEDLRDAGL